LKTTPFDPADYLATDTAVATYLSEAMGTGDLALIADALAVVERARAHALRPANLRRDS